MNDRQQGVPLEDSFDELALKQVPFGIEHLKITVQAALVPNQGQPVRLSQRVHEKLLLRELLGCFAVGDQRIGDFAKCGLDGLLVARQRFPLNGFGQLYVRPQASRIEDRQICDRIHSPLPGGTYEQIRERAALAAHEPGQ